jgi:hypothetical protein
MNACKYTSAAIAHDNNKVAKTKELVGE